MFARTKPHKRIVAVTVCSALLAVGGAVVLLKPGATAATLAPAPIDPGSATAADALVFVSGAVVHPGLYRLSTNARVSDAIAAAGGLLPTADLGKLPNLAARVHDGRQVNVPLSKSGSAGSAVVKVDVNSAAVDELAAIPGMPLGLPQAILEYRTTWGAFSSLSQLRTALGLDAATMKALSPWWRVVAP